MHRSVRFLFVLAAALAVVLQTCTHAAPPGCAVSSLTRAEIRAIVEDEIRRRGGSPDPNRSSRIRVRRKGCDYIYTETSLPKRPGGFLVVRLNEAGEVIEFLPGL